MTHGSLFSGIGGFDLAAEWMGWQNKFHCEWNEFGQRVLHHYWPKAELFTDITKSNFKKYANTIDVLTGGFPCQPYSAAGKRLGKEDERHLWPEMLRAIREIAPRYVVGENVRGLTNWNGGMVFDEVCTDLENLGYKVAPYLIPACATNAPHRRERIWFIAYRDIAPTKYKISTGGDMSSSKSNNGNASDTDQRTTRPPRESRGLEGNGSDGHILEEQRRAEAELDYRLHAVPQPTSDTDGLRQLEREREHEEHEGEGRQHALDDADTNVVHANGNGLQGRIKKNEPTISRSQLTKSITSIQPNRFENFPTQPPICGGNDGLPTELDGITFSKWRAESIKAYGNAVVPQVVYQIFKAIEAHETIR